MTPIEALDHLVATRDDLPAVAATYLDARCQFALARAMLTVAPCRAHYLAKAAWRAVVNIAHDAPTAAVPWELRSENPLVFAFEQAREIGEQWRSHDADRRARIAAVELERQRCVQERAEKRIRAEAATPGAEALLERLAAGETLELNGHSLAWNKEAAMLLGTNPYGMDYFMGDMTVACVGGWRTGMLDGRILGQCPPGGDDDDVDLDMEISAAAHEFAEDLYWERLSLQNMCNWVFTPDLLGVFPAEPTDT